MPNLKSSKKRMRQNATLREHNRAIRSNFRNRCKKVLQAVEAGDAKMADDLFKVAVQKLDRAAAKNVIHKNAAARTKSRLQARIKAIK